MSNKYELPEAIINDLKLKNKYSHKRDIKRIMNYFSGKRVDNFERKEPSHNI